MSDKKLTMYPSLNVLGEELKPCSNSPITGVFSMAAVIQGGPIRGSTLFAA